MNRRIIKARTLAARKGTSCITRVVLGVGLVLAACGCGSDLNEFLRQVGDSAGRVLVDVLLTDLANAVAEIGEQVDAPESPDPIDDDTGDPGDVPPPGDVEPDAVEGEAIYAANNCAACHCADAAGGCALDSPALIGVAIEELDEHLVGDVPHAGGKFGFSAQDLADLEAYLASL